MFPFQNTYARLPERFFARLEPQPVSRPRCIRINRELAHDLGLDPDELATPRGVAALAGNRVPDGAEPLAAAYAGHQFGSWNPQLGDGRAALLGEVVDSSGLRFDIQLKGSGPTPFSRGGDGRSPIGPVLREYIVSEAMYALGVPTTRALAAVATGETVFRDTPLPGGILTRVARSHIRVGTFEYFAARQDVDAIRKLVAYVCERHYPDAVDSEKPAVALLRSVVMRQAELIARWQLLGFIHGVMNTDNMLVSGETIDYGPCAFMDEYDPRKVFSSIDRGGRYAFENQPAIARWNLHCLARALLPAVGGRRSRAEDDIAEALRQFTPSFERAFVSGMRDKLGLGEERELDGLLAGDFLVLLASERLNYTLAFSRLTELAATDVGGGNRCDTGYPWEHTDAARDWLERWRRRTTGETTPAAERARRMAAVNPVLIPRNHQIEAAIVAAVERDDLAPFHAMVDALQDPFDPTHASSELAQPPGPEQVVRQTFCGT